MSQLTLNDDVSFLIGIDSAVTVRVRMSSSPCWGDLLLRRLSVGPPLHALQHEPIAAAVISRSFELAIETVSLLKKRAAEAWAFPGIVNSLRPAYPFVNPGHSASTEEALESRGKCRSAKSVFKFDDQLLLSV